MQKNMNKNIFSAKAIEGVKIFNLPTHSDERGELYELWVGENHFATESFVQDNIVKCKVNVLRGMHYQKNNPYSQIITLISGKIFDVLLDLRPGSPTFKQSTAYILDGSKNIQLYMPSGIAHGYVSLTDNVIISYKCNEKYQPTDEVGVLWSSIPEIKWPVNEKTKIKNRDQNFKKLNDLVDNDLPKVIDTNKGDILYGC
jgi:dTDP-4-dehydrorhamnose 3,5-epimerase